MDKSHEKTKSPAFAGASPWLKALAVKLGEDVVASSEWVESNHAVDFGKEVFPAPKTVHEWVVARPAFSAAMGNLSETFGSSTVAKWVSQPDGSEGGTQVGRAIDKAWASLKKDAVSYMLGRQKIHERELLSTMASQHGLRVVRFVKS